jgi:hypothetical protein
MLGIVLVLLNFEKPTIHYTTTIPNIYLLVRAECVRCPWLLAETKVATILDIFGPSGVRAPAVST